MVRSDMAYQIIGLLACIAAYRLCKHVIRKCLCGSMFYIRFHKLEKAGSGQYSTYTFRQCFHCGDFVLLKSENKYFSWIELGSRLIRPWQFWNVDRCLRRAGIVVNAPKLFTFNAASQRRR